MGRRFNTAGACNPQRHYMVNLDERLRQIREDYVDEGSYFVINRGRQYGKTTILIALEKYLMDAYIVISLDFQEIGTEDFADAAAFVAAFSGMVLETLGRMGFDSGDALLQPLTELAGKEADRSLKELFVSLGKMCACAQKPIVLMIDEVDSASNNQVFIDFLAQLRGFYLKRDKTPIFHAVILAGVYNIRNLKLKLRSETEHQYNSPWNIAADFDIEMSFSAKEIAAMLMEYEADCHTGMDVGEVAEEIFKYTSGYPVLVSAICKRVDEKLLRSDTTAKPQSAWSKAGIEKAVKMILTDNTPLFGSMIRHLDDYPSMKQMFHAMLFQGREFLYNPDTKEISLACMFGYAVDRDGKVQIANRIFETRLYNYFLSEEELSSAIGNMAQRDKSYFIHDGRLDMDMTLRKFVEYFADIYGTNDDRFIEANGRKIFLMFLRPIINGTGNYYIEAQTRDARRTDVIVDYRGEQFVIELKIWHGAEYNVRGERQLAEYLDYYHKTKGYLLSFNFNKEKVTGVKEIVFADKVIVEAVV
ncbi:MAG: AAA-like domain-containing protein [Lachnospiraceae bacterium]|nr:AAA-like domain-containing protein [Lachnospiraceae bacterium]